MSSHFCTAAADSNIRSYHERTAEKHRVVESKESGHLEPKIETGSSIVAYRFPIDGEPYGPGEVKWPRPN